MNQTVCPIPGTRLGKGKNTHQERKQLLDEYISTCVRNLLVLHYLILKTIPSFFQMKK